MAAPLLTGLVAAGVLAWGSVPVRDVQIDAPGAESVAVLRGAFHISPGDALSRDAVRRGVLALMATHTVEDVTVTATPAADGVTLHVAIQVASRVARLEIEGLPRRDRKLVTQELGIAVGAPLQVPQFEAALVRARQRVREDGFPDAALDPDLDFDVKHGTVNVVIRGSLGAPRTVGSVAAPGSELDEAAVWKATGLSRGDRLTTGTLDGARRRLASALRRDGYWEAVVQETRAMSESGPVDIELTVARGPRYALDLKGLSVSRSLESEALPFLRGDEPFTPTAVEHIEHAVRTFLQREGYLLATVKGSLDEESNPRAFTVRVEKGARTPIVAVRFPGIEGVPDAALLDRVGARKGRPWRWGREPVDDDTLQADAASIQATLHELGYADATVDPPRITPEDDGAAIEFPVHQGSRRLVTEIEILGVPDGVQRPELPLERGGPWSAGAQAHARDVLLNAMRDAGYPDVRIEGMQSCDETQCAVSFNVSPGEKVDVDRIVTAGLVRTKRTVVRRVGGLKPGAWIGPDEQLAAQRRLLGLGIFRSVALRPIPGQNYGPTRGLVLDLQEAPSRSVGFGVGWNNVDRLRVSASWSELNLFGLARSLFFESTVSSRDKRFQLSYREPARLGLLGFPTGVAVYRTEETTATYNFLRRGMWVELGDRQRRPLRALLRYDYQIVRNDAPDEIKSQLERDRQNLAMASITPILEWDSRDDVFTPTRGLYGNVELSRGFRVFSADVELLKVSASVAGYHRLGGGVLAASLRAGGIDPIGTGTAGAECPTDNCQVPVAERFFAGGRISHRAFPTDLLGIPGETIRCTQGTPDSRDCHPAAIGGAGLLLASAEWRVPVWGPVGMSVFVDGGNVWPSWRSVQVSQMRWGAGLGLRVMTPVGPFRLEYGWKTRREPYESPGELFLSFGNPF